MANIGEQLLLPEEGWNRTDDANENIIYSEDVTWLTQSNGIQYNDTLHYSLSKGSITFKFFGTKLRIIGSRYSNRSSDIQVKIDNILDKTFSQIGSSVSISLDYETPLLEKNAHTIEIINGNNVFALDAIDIYEGYIISKSGLYLTDESITIDKNLDETLLLKLKYNVNIDDISTSSPFLYHKLYNDNNVLLHTEKIDIPFSSNTVEYMSSPQ